MLFCRPDHLIDLVFLGYAVGHTSSRSLDLILIVLPLFFQKAHLVPSEEVHCRCLSSAGGSYYLLVEMHNH